MNNKLVFSGSSIMMLLLLVTFVALISGVYAQGDLNISESQIVDLKEGLVNVSNTNTKEIISSIITPWNTGNR
ncbi:MAG TPA: hypothetical protein VJR94_01600 [Candidatus Nitrosocosmicus sp.]|nr:hypothetical protein [Candidatus Nitrosocosmicus sp.]